MTCRIVIRAEAEADLSAACGWYEQRRSGLGEDFLISVEACLAAAARYPRRSPVIHGEVRRAVIRRFPFSVFYVAEEDAIVVLAVFHASRDPGAWHDRIP